jgi:hypothetical protein
LSEIVVRDVNNDSGDEVQSRQSPSDSFFGVMIFKPESDFVVLELDDAARSDSRALGVPADISSCLLSAFEFFANVDIPVFVFGVGELKNAFYIARENEHEFGLDSISNSSENLGSPEGFNGGMVEVVLIDPFLMIEGKSAARNEDVDVGVELQISAKGVRHRHDARDEATSTAVFQKSIFCSSEKDIEAHNSIGLNESPQEIWNSKDDVLIGDVG